MSSRRAKNRPKRSPAEQPATPVVAFVSLGCAKNLVDSEKMLGQIAESGALISADESVADTVVVNTCGFLDAARQEALDIIRDLAARKRAGQLERLVIAGCLVQRDGERLREEIPEIDVLVGVNNRDDVARAIWRHDRDARTDRYLGDYHPQPWTDRGRLRITPAHYAYVRMSEGCNQKCTFCTIPSIRGPLHSKPVAEIVHECRELIADGARELVLIGQDTTSYGADLDYEPGLAGLLRELDAACDGARWLRLMYAYPSAFTDTMIDAVAECERVVNYIDIPLQHINDRMLRAMGRRVNRERTERLLDKLRQRIPGVTIRTTFIVGFPGETEAEFQELLDFIRDFHFDAVGAFEYSDEPDTPAARIPGHLSPELIAERHQQLMLAQQELAFTQARRFVGKTFDVVVDGPAPDGHTTARHAGQAPEVDPVCIIPGTPHRPSTQLPVDCIDTAGYDLIVRPRRVILPQC